MLSIPTKTMTLCGPQKVGTTETFTFFFFGLSNYIQEKIISMRFYTNFTQQ